MKFDRPGRIRQVVEHIAKHGSQELLAHFGDDVSLVPAPRSAPHQKGALWVAKRICDELLLAGLADSVEVCLHRTHAVQKSAFASVGERPAPEVHLDSLLVQPTVISSPRILVVDDIITKGATLLAAASRVSASYPTQQVAVFGLIRTMGLVPDVESVVSSTVGHVRLLASGAAWRDP